MACLLPRWRACCHPPLQSASPGGSRSRSRPGVCRQLRIAAKEAGGGGTVSAEQQLCKPLRDAASRARVANSTATLPWPASPARI